MRSNISITVILISILFGSTALAQVPLDPGNGGRSITVAALRAGDIILSTTPAWISERIRDFTNGPVSHARLYIGDGHVIEAVPFEGVLLRSLSEAMDEDQVAVAFRPPKLRSSQERQIADFAMMNLGKPYNWIGAVASGFFSNQGDPVDVNLGPSGQRTYFCTPLVLDAYLEAGVRLSDPQVTPNEIVPLTWLQRLEYVGHLKFVP